MTTIIKLAAKRDRETPVGQPGKIHFDCPCGKQIDSPRYPDGPNLHCACGLELESDGWIVT
jgi:hypothetical protein